MTRIGLDEATEMFLDDKRIERAWKTYGKYESVLNVFSEWYEKAGVESLADLDGGDLHKFKQYCRHERNNEEVSLNGTMAFLRVFIAFCEEIEAVRDGLADKVPVPEVDDEEEVSDEMPVDKHMEKTLEYYREYESVSRIRIELELAAEGLLRLGAMRAIDEDDHDADKQTIKLRHRPEDNTEPGTPLKNKEASERIINISERLNDAVQKYKEKRDSVEDKYGRKPLLVTDDGRVGESTVRRDFYKALRPCKRNQKCPHDKEPDECAWTKAKQASKCPSSYSPHPIRRWGIVDHLEQGVPIEKVSERADVSVPVLKKHYDPFSEKRAQQDREETLNEHHDAFGGSNNQSVETNQSPETTGPESQDPTRPIDAVTQSLRERLNCPLVIQWFIEDLHAGSQNSTYGAPTKVMKGVIVYCITTVTVEVGAFLTGIGNLPA